MAESIFFILGAGASFDSGLPTYRGPEGLYNDDIDPADILSVDSPLDTVWDFLVPLYEKIGQSQPGPTYELIKELGKKYPDSFILTQNIDGHALHTGLPVVEIHGNWKYMHCTTCETEVGVALGTRDCSCGGRYKPNIVLYGQGLPKKEVTSLNKLINTNHPTKVVVVGTTLQFPYLRNYIAKAKAKGAQVVHINPDESYGKKVMYNELWLKVTSKEGLTTLLETL